jgi:hypothetical protein
MFLNNQVSKDISQLNLHRKKHEMEIFSFMVTIISSTFERLTILNQHQPPIINSTTTRLWQDVLMCCIPRQRLWDCWLQSAPCPLSFPFSMTPPPPLLRRPPFWYNDNSWLPDFEDFLTDNNTNVMHPELLSMASSR